MSSEAFLVSMLLILNPIQDSIQRNHQLFLLWLIILQLQVTTSKNMLNVNNGDTRTIWENRQLLYLEVSWYLEALG